MINAEALAVMKQGAYFINLSRGNLVDDAALLAVLDSGHLGGAGVDVRRISTSAYCRCRTPSQGHRHASYRRADAWLGRGAMCRIGQANRGDL